MSKIMVIRHAEKPDKPPPKFGVDETGAQDKHDLIVRGWQRAGGLACLFALSGAATRDGLAVPKTIYATSTQTDPSLRPQHTVAPLAARLVLTADITFDLGTEAALALKAAEKTAAGPVLIAWHHEAIPTLANKILGDATTAPQKWPDDRFDMVWVFDRVDGDSTWSFSQIPQNLLAGDLLDLIPKVVDPDAGH